VTGEQTTTTTTIETSLPVIIATEKPYQKPPSKTFGPDDDTQEYFRDLLEKKGIAFSHGTPECFKSDLDAPQRDGDGTPSVQSKIEEFCESMNGKTLTKSGKGDGVDTEFLRYNVAYYSFWLSASSWYQSTTECPDSSKIRKTECVRNLNKAMTTCDPNSGRTHGASFHGSCIQYNITLSLSRNDNDPPWNPAPDPSCSEKLTPVTYRFFNKLFPVFCDEVNKDSKEGLVKDLSNADFPKRKRSYPAPMEDLRERTPPPSSSDYDGYTFHFDWSGGEGGCRSNCFDSYSAISGACGYQVMPDEGSLDVGCGTFAYSIKVPPKPTPTESPTGTLTTLAATVPASPVSCYGGTDTCDYHDVEPGTARKKSDTFCDDHGSQDAFNGPGWPAIQDDSTDFFDDVSYNWKVLWKPDCVGDNYDKLNVGQPIPEFSCKQAMRMTFDQCNNQGHGGRVEVGCLEYYFNPVNSWSEKCTNPF
jgi:hypothetical protein